MESRPRRRFLDGVKERRERHRERSKVVRAAVVLAGFVVVLVGLAMIPLPGPGLLVVAAGLALLALEFVWAERVLERTIDQMGEATDRVKRASRAQQAILVLLGALVASAAVTAAYAWDIPVLPV
ncbi:MAG: PGPGW domain-containing protein [Actinomycetota bacterium]